MNNVVGKKKIILIVSIIVGIVILGLVGTYAWYVWSTSEDEHTKIVTNIGVATVLYDGGADIESATLLPTSDKSNGIVKRISAGIDQTSTTGRLSFNLYLDVKTLDNNLKDSSFKFELWKGNTLIKSGNFGEEYLNTNLVTCNTNSTSHIVLFTDELLDTSISIYTLYLWIDGTVDNSYEMANKSFEFTLHADGQNAVVDEEYTTLTQFITNLYDSAEKTPISSIHVYEYASGQAAAQDSYNYATSVSLMMDRFGIPNRNGSYCNTIDCNVGNIRYYGANPNNYIDIGDRDSNGNVILYRIIGLFKDIELADGSKQDLVKVIRHDSIGEYSFDNKSSGIGSSTSNYGSNDWTDSRLMMLLNPGYDTYSASNPLLDNNGNTLYGYTGSLWWNSKSGSCYEGWASETNTVKSCNFTSSGLSSDIHDKIETVVWHLGGINTISLEPRDVYFKERETSVYSGRQTEWLGKVALMYMSDYGYAADLRSDKCRAERLDGYSDSNCTSNNWLYYGDKHQWTLTPISNSPHFGALMYSNGNIVNGYVNVGIHSIRPSFYLKADLPFWGIGDGTIDNPYQI